jgi:ferredoxin
MSADEVGPIAVYLNRRTCAGSRTCEVTAPGVFRYVPDAGTSQVLTEVVEDPATIARVRDAEELCPTQSIHIAS